MDKIIDFIIKYSIYKDRKKIENIVRLHLLYKTCIVVYDNPDDDNIIAMARWNIMPSGKTAHICDLIIHPKYRNKNMIKRLLIKGIRTFPEVKTLVWERETKYPNRESRFYNISRILKGVNECSSLSGVKN